VEGADSTKKPHGGSAGEPQPGDEIDEWRITTELADAHVRLAAVIRAVRSDLEHRVAEGRRTGPFREPLSPGKNQGLIERGFVQFRDEF